MATTIPTEPGRLDAALVEKIVARFETSSRPAIGDRWNAGGHIFVIATLDEAGPSHIHVEFRKERT